MPEPRNDMPLPPLPWRTNESKTRILDAEGEQIAQITCPHWGAVADLLLRAREVEQAARDALNYLEEVGPYHLDAVMEESGCDQITERLRMALGDEK